MKRKLRDDERAAINKIVVRLLEEAKMDIYSNITNRADYCHAYGILDGLRLAGFLTKGEMDKWREEAAEAVGLWKVRKPEDLAPSNP